MKIRKGDTIKVLYGKDTGKEAVVLAVDTKKRTIVADGVNVYKRHVKGDGRNKTSEIVSVVKPMPVSKVILVCPSCKKSTRVGMKIENDKKMRICKKCGKEIDIQDETKMEKKETNKKKATSKKTSTKKKETSKKTTKKSTTKKVK